MQMIYELFRSDLDTKVDENRKKTLVVCGIGSMFYSGVMWFEHPQFTMIYQYANCTVVFIQILALIKWYITKSLRDYEVSILLISYTILMLSVDITLAAEWRHRVWPLLAVHLDICLICSAPRYTATTIISILVIYVSVDTIEGITRFGLYDITGGEKMKLIKQCINVTQQELNMSPCPLDISIAGGPSAAYLTVVLFDYFVTKRFATDLEDEKRKLGASISLAETIAAALVRFDLDEAEYCLEASETELSEILRKLLHNLHEYRPYLPDSLFELNDDFSVTCRAKPPADFAAVLFTDLKSSTAIWEASPDAMKKALKIHNKIIRKCINEMRGYEVKTIGDSFMVAFEMFSDAVSFAMIVQERLTTTVWPSNLVLPDIFEANGWNGLTVRIGLHYGEVEAEFNTLNGRTDYFGRTVNRAARLEGACIPGGVAVDSSFASQLDVFSGWGTTGISEKLKGIDDNPVAITVLLQDHQLKQNRKVSISGESSQSTFTRPSSCSDTCSDAPDSKFNYKQLATVCVARIRIKASESNFQSQINNALGRSIGCLERTEGSIVSVLSSSITIGWNTAKPCTTHFHNSLRFVSLMYGTFSFINEISIGLSSGPVHCGRVGTKDQRFVTVFGHCVDNCALLCQGSSDLGAFALCAKCPPFSLLRPVDRWGGTVIYQLQVGKLREYFAAQAKTSEVIIIEGIEWGWSEHYTDAFDKFDFELIEAERDPADNVLLRVSKMIREGTSLRTSIEVDDYAARDLTL